MSAAPNRNGYASEEALFELHRDMREAPTLPKLPESLDAEELLRAVADSFSLFNARQTKIVRVLEAMHKDATIRHEELLAAIGALAAKR